MDLSKLPNFARREVARPMQAGMAAVAVPEPKKHCEGDAVQLAAGFVRFGSDKDPHVLARNIASGHIGSCESDWLRSGFSAWLGNSGSLQLDRCLHLPTSHKKMARAERDRHLREAWDLLDDASPWRKSVCLAEEIKKFETRIWPAWKSYQAPPQGASELRKLLFMAMRSGASMPSTVQQVNNICNPSD